MQKPSRLSVNVLANAAGQLSSTGLALLFTPLYIRWLGIDAYWLIGFYITLRGSAEILEVGLSRACNRELARYSAQGPSTYQYMLDILRSLELVYWAVAVMLGVLLTNAAAWIASSWLISPKIPAIEIQDTLLIMAWVIAMRWPMGLYMGALLGLEKQILMNTIQVLASILNWAGSAAVLWLIRPDINLFFRWQLLVALVSTILFALIAWRSMPGRFLAGRFSMKIIRGMMPFATGVGGNAILGMVLRQADKLILSAILPLNQFGYYALASVIAGAIATLANPVSNAVFPRFSQLLVLETKAGQISSAYHLACQAVSVLIIPVTLVIVFFPYEVLFVYTGSADIAANSAVVLAILSAAKMLHASMIVPYALQLAAGWVKLGFYMNLVSVFWLVPSTYWLAKVYGPAGASLAWLAVTINYVAVGIPLMHHRLLPGEWSRWFWRTLIGPLAAVAVFMFFVYWMDSLLPEDRWSQGVFLLGIAVTAIFIAALSAIDVRQWLFAVAKKRGYS